MASENKQISIPEEYREQGNSLSLEFQDAGLGSLTHGDIYKAGLEAKRAILERYLAMTSERK